MWDIEYLLWNEKVAEKSEEKGNEIVLQIS